MQPVTFELGVTECACACHMTQSKPKALKMYSANLETGFAIPTCLGCIEASQRSSQMSFADWVYQEGLTESRTHSAETS